MRKAPILCAVGSWQDRSPITTPEGVKGIIHPAPSRKQGGFASLETMKIGGRSYPIVGTVNSKAFGAVPLVDIPMMSDYRWQQKALQDRLEHSEKYRLIGEDVEETISQLREWMDAHREAAQA